MDKGLFNIRYDNEPGRFVCDKMHFKINSFCAKKTKFFFTLKLIKEHLIIG